MVESDEITVAFPQIPIMSSTATEKGLCSIGIAGTICGAPDSGLSWHCTLFQRALHAPPFSFSFNTEHKC